MYPLPLPSSLRETHMHFPAIMQLYGIRHDIMNPWRDKIIEEFQTIQFSLLQMAAANFPNMNATYWNKLSTHDQLISEIQGWQAHEAFKSFFALERLYIDSEISPISEIELPMEGSPAYARIMENYQIARADEFKIRNDLMNLADAGHKALRLEETDPYLIQWGVPDYLVPPLTYAHAKHRQAISRAEETQHSLLYGEQTEAMEYAAREWRNDSSFMQRALDMSYFKFLTEIDSLRITANTLTGAAGKTRTLLTDSDIPLPTLQTALLWWSLCGIEAKRVYPDSIYLAFTHPHMPVTRDQLPGGGALQTEDTHSNHSLPARSGGHIRTEGGRVIHGLHRMWGQHSFMWEGQALTTSQFSQGVSDSMMTRPHTVIRASMPAPRSNAVDLIWAGHDHVITSILNPWETAGRPLHTDWMRDYAISTSMRHQAKMMNLHYMFTNTPQGEKALESWRQALTKVMLQWIRLTKHERYQLMVQTVVDTASHKTPEIKTRTAATGQRFTFDFSTLNQ